MVNFWLIKPPSVRNLRMIYSVARNVDGTFELSGQRGAKPGASG
jgi:hypothetical protein